MVYVRSITWWYLFVVCFIYRLLNHFFFSISCFIFSTQEKKPNDIRMIFHPNHTFAAVRCSVSLYLLNFMYVTKIVFVEPYVANELLVMRSHKRDFFDFFSSTFNSFIWFIAEIGRSEYTYKIYLQTIEMGNGDDLNFTRVTKSYKLTVCGSWINMLLQSIVFISVLPSFFLH